MVEQGLHHERSRLVEVGEEREQRLFLLAEVRHGLGGDELDEGPPCGLGIVVAIGRISQPTRLDGCVMMVVRQRDQSRVAFPDGNVPPAREERR